MNTMDCCNAKTRAGWPCTRPVLPGTQRCRQHQGRPPRRPIGEQDGIPIVAGQRQPGREYDGIAIDCPYCGAEHYHGAGRRGSPVGSGDGHRVAHCMNDHEGRSSRGYIIREVAA